MIAKGKERRETIATYSYTASGELLSSQANGVHLDYFYDGFGRVTDIFVPIERRTVLAKKGSDPL
jgi:YD repeat-containing protein